MGIDFPGGLYAKHNHQHGSHPCGDYRHLRRGGEESVQTPRTSAEFGIT